MLLDVLSLEDEDEDVEDDVEDAEDDDFDDVACSLALVNVEFVVELVPDMVIFAMLLEFMLEPAMVELLEAPAVPVELLLDLDSEGDMTPPFELEEGVDECEGAVAEPVDGFEVGFGARATTASVGQLEHPPNS